MVLLVLFVIVLAIAIFTVEWSNKNFSEVEERKAIETEEKPAEKVVYKSTPEEEPDVEEKTEHPRPTGVVIRGRRTVEGKDTTISAGHVYPIYTYVPKEESTTWRCAICDAENYGNAETCCVCQHSRAESEVPESNHGSAASTQNSVQPNSHLVESAQVVRQKDQPESASKIEKIDEKVSEPKGDIIAQKAKRINWLVLLVLCVGAMLAFQVGLRYSFRDVKQVTPLSIVESILPREVKISGNVYSVKETTRLDAGIIQTQEDIDAIGRLTNLTEVSLTWLNNSDVDLSTFSNLTQLTKLSVNCTTAKVTSFDFLRSLTSLKELTLVSTGIGNMDDILNMTELTSLTLRNDGITTEFNNAGLTQLSKLESLNVSGNEITDLSFLRYIPTLKSLDVLENDLISPSPVTYCSGLETLKIDTLTDIGVLQTLSSLNYLTLGTGQSYLGKDEIDSYVTELLQANEEVLAAVSTASELIALFESGQYDAVYSRQQDIYDTCGSFMCKEGTLTLVNGRQTITTPVEISDGKFLKVIRDTSIYYGGYEDNQKSGQGTQVEIDSYLKYYAGEWANNYPDGHGTACMFSSKSKPYYISGNFKNGYQDGVMTLIDYEDGYKATGQYTVVDRKKQSLGTTSDGHHIYCYMDNGTYWFVGNLLVSQICDN